MTLLESWLVVSGYRWQYWRDGPSERCVGCLMNPFALVIDIRQPVEVMLNCLEYWYVAQGTSCS